jgi:hypothetical protein
MPLIIRDKIEDPPVIVTGWLSCEARSDKDAGFLVRVHGRMIVNHVDRPSSVKIYLLRERKTTSRLANGEFRRIDDDLGVVSTQDGKVVNHDSKIAANATDWTGEISVKTGVDEQYYVEVRPITKEGRYFLSVNGDIQSWKCPVVMPSGQSENAMEKRRSGEGPRK